MSPLNNLHPLHPGSSFYKASREDGLYSAVKFFPFSFSDEQAIEFEKRVKLVRQAIDEYQADIPRVMDWRVKTDKPFIEFDWIVGMSLAEKFKIEKNSLLTISDISEVAEQISKAITLCHKIGLQHGAVSMKEIIWDASKKRYALAGFFSHLSSTQLNQHSSEDLQKKDIKDLSTVLLQLFTGRDDVEGLDEKEANLAREKAIPPHWSIEDKRNEKEMPYWFWQLIAAGMEGKYFNHMGDFYFLLIKNNKHPLIERSYRSKPFAHAPSAPVKKIENVSELYNFPSTIETKKSRSHFVFDGKMAAGFLVAALLFGFSMFSQKKQPGEKKLTVSNEVSSEPVIPLVRKLDNDEKPAEIKKPLNKKQKKGSATDTQSSSKQFVPDTSKASSLIAKQDQAISGEEKSSPEVQGFFMVKSKAYFHNQPDETTKRNGFINHWNNAILIPEKEENDFFYVVYTNSQGRTSRGWLKKSDLVEVGEK